MGSSLEFITFKLKEHWNAFFLIKIYSSKFTSIKKHSLQQAAKFSLFPGYLRLLVSSIPGSPVFPDTLQGSPTLPASHPRRPRRECGEESAVKSFSFEKMMRVSSSFTALSDFRKGGFKGWFLTWSFYENQNNFYCVLRMSFFTHSKHDCLAWSLWILGSQLVTTYIGKWLPSVWGQTQSKRFWNEGS